MPASDSDSSGSEEEVDPAQILEELSLDKLNGRWQHSMGDFLNVVDGNVKFDMGTTYTLVQVGDTVELDGWRAVLSKSNSNRIVWAKEGEKPMHWRFESEIEAEGGDVKPDDEGISEDNIITGKRRRKGVDYAELHKKMAKEKGFEDDESDDESRARKKKRRLEELARSSSSSSSSSFTTSSYAAEKKAEPSKPKKLSQPELLSIRDKLGFEGALMESDKLLPLLKQLERHPMDLDTLKSTKIGKAVNRYRKHTNSVVASRILAVVKKWKKLMPKA